MRPAFRNLGTLLVVVLAGCGEAVSPKDELAAARQRWERYGPSSYDLTIRYRCGECMAEITYPVLVSVRNREVVSRTFVMTGQPATFEGGWYLWPVVDVLFQQIDEAIASEAFALSMSFDAVRGYPTNVFIDRDKDAVDDEHGWTVVDFVAR